MRVLVACEYSGRVRDAFYKAGHEAVSCDLLPTDSIGPHYQGNVFRENCAGTARSPQLGHIERILII
jgi:hypothetical protein